MFLHQNIKNYIYSIYINRQGLCSYQMTFTDAITRQEKQALTTGIFPLAEMHYYVGWQEGDLQNTTAQQHAIVETCCCFHAHQQTNRSADVQQKELKTEGK